MLRELQSLEISGLRGFWIQRFGVGIRAWDSERRVSCVELAVQFRFWTVQHQGIKI